MVQAAKKKKIVGMFVISRFIGLDNCTDVLDAAVRSNVNFCVIFVLCYEYIVFSL
jgi:hypothetical protein